MTTRLEVRNKLETKRDTILTGYQNGMSLAEVQALFDVPVARNTIRDFLVENGVTIRPRGRRRKETTNGAVS